MVWCVVLVVAWPGLVGRATENTRCKFYVNLLVLLAGLCFVVLLHIITTTDRARPGLCACSCIWTLHPCAASWPSESSCSAAAGWRKTSSLHVRMYIRWVCNGVVQIKLIIIMPIKARVLSLALAVPNQEHNI